MSPIYKKDLIIPFMKRITWPYPAWDFKIRIIFNWIKLKDYNTQKYTADLTEKAMKVKLSGVQAKPTKSNYDFLISLFPWEHCF